MVKRLFEEYATGLYSLNEIRKKTIDWGLKNKTKAQSYLSVSQVDQILKNSFYYGVMKHKGNLYPHIYKPIISRELFRECDTNLHSRYNAFRLLRTDKLIYYSGF